jgi:hypothetical protein
MTGQRLTATARQFVGPKRNGRTGTENCEKGPNSSSMQSSSRHSIHSQSMCHEMVLEKFLNLGDLPCEVTPDQVRNGRPRCSPISTSCAQSPGTCSAARPVQPLRLACAWRISIRWARKRTATQIPARETANQLCIVRQTIRFLLSIAPTV